MIRGMYPLGDSLKDRPFIIVADEDPILGTVIVCTTRDATIWSDSTTRLTANCHPLIDSDCTVVYGEAKVFRKVELDLIRQGIQAGTYRFEPKDILLPRFIKDIQDGFGEKNGVPLVQRDLPFAAQEYAKSRGIV